MNKKICLELMEKSLKEVVYYMYEQRDNHLSKEISDLQLVKEALKGEVSREEMEERLAQQKTLTPDHKGQGA